MKNKILKFLPYGLIFLLLAIIAGVFLLRPRNVEKPNIKAADTQPVVLGEATSSNSSVRGDLPGPQEPIMEIKTPDLSNLKAKSFLVFDLATGQDLVGQNSTTTLAIASLTKLMTGLVAYNNSDLSKSFSISRKDISTVKPVLGLAEGDSVNALDIFNAMLVGSCNDAALALADYTASTTGKDFVELMNQTAATLGMQNSHFGNPMGFDFGQNYSSAQDLKILIGQTQKLSAFTVLGRQAEYSFTNTDGKGYFTIATNKLIQKYPDLEAIKTGYTGEAGGAMATKLNIGNYQIVILVLDSQDREGDTLKLRDEVLNDFKW